MRQKKVTQSVVGEFLARQNAIANAIALIFFPVFATALSVFCFGFVDAHDNA